MGKRPIVTDEIEEGGQDGVESFFQLPLPVEWLRIQAFDVQRFEWAHDKIVVPLGRAENEERIAAFRERRWLRRTAASHVVIGVAVDVDFWRRGKGRVRKRGILSILQLQNSKPM